MKNRKRVLSVLLALAVVFTMCITAAVAVDTGSGSAAKITVETVKKAVKVGDTVTLNVSIAGNPGFVAFDFTVEYDAAKLELAKTEKGIFSGELYGGDKKTNQVNFTGPLDKECTGDGVLFTLTFNVKADCADGAQVKLNTTTFKNAQNVKLFPTIVAGGINVTTGGSTPGSGSTGNPTSGGGSTGNPTSGGGSTGNPTSGGGSTGNPTSGGGSTGNPTSGGGSTGNPTSGGGSTGNPTSGGGSTGDKPSGGTTADYKIIEGANGTWTQNSDGTLTFRANGEFSKFTGVKVDGKLIDRENYTAKSGSTIVTLSKDYLATLPVGNHSLTVVFNDGECSTDFTVKAAGDNTNPGDNTKPGETVTPGNNADGPQTGDHSSIVLAVAVLLVSGGALTVLAIAKKKAGKC